MGLRASYSIFLFFPFLLLILFIYFIIFIYMAFVCFEFDFWRGAGVQGLNGNFNKQ